jgi:hypothetical protein
MFTFHKTRHDAAAGTSLRGFVLAAFDDLVSTLGPPDTDWDRETPALWTLAFDDGTIATLYCYKCSSVPKQFCPWHVGGHSEKAVTCLAAALGSVLLDYRDFSAFWFEYLRIFSKRPPGATFAWVDPMQSQGDDLPIPF